MKKTVVIFALAFGYVLNTFAVSSTEIFNSTTTVKTIKSVSPFCISIAKGDFEVVKKLVKLGEDVNKKSNGMTPVMYAAKFNRVEILKFLVAQGADLNKKCDKGHKAEYYAKLSNAKEALSAIEALQSKKKK